MNTIGLLKHNIERFGAVTVMDVTLFDYAGDYPVLELDTLKMSNISGEGQVKEIRGGMSADLLLTHNYARSTNVEFQDALASLSSLEVLWGGKIKRDEITYHVTKEVTTSAGGTIDTATWDEAVTEVLSVVDSTTGDVYPATFATGTITLTGVTAATAVKVYYLATAVEGVDGYVPIELVLKSNMFPKTVKMVGKTIVIDQVSGKEILAEIEVPKLKLNASFALNLESEGDAAVFDFGGMALSHSDEKELIKIKTIKAVEGML